MNLNVHPSPPIRVFHVCQEYENSEVGGLASMLKTLANGQVQKGLKVYIVQPKYGFLEEKVTHLKERLLKFTFDGKEVEARIYKEKVGHVTVYYLDGSLNRSLTKDFFALSHPMNIYKRHRDVEEDVFAVSQPMDIYKPHGNIDSVNRFVFFCKIAAEFIKDKMAKSKHPEKYRNIVHNHSWLTGLMPTLLRELPKKDRKTMAFVNTVHMHCPWEQGQNTSPSILQKAGIHRHYPINMTREVLHNAHITTIVSENAKYEALSDEKGYGLQHDYRKLDREGRLYGIVNPFDNSVHNPQTNPVLKKLGFDFTADNAHKVKAKIKHYLYEQGYLKDPKAPLFVFVGRFSWEKGINMLPKALETIDSHGGQLVVMGFHCNDPYASAVIHELEGSSEALTLIPTLEGQKVWGDLIRAAADFALVPSHLETCGLAPLEMMNYGAMVIGCQGGGLAEFLNDKVAFQYQDHNSHEELKSALNKAFHQYKRGMKSRLKEVMHHVQQYTASNPKGPIQKMIDVYHRAFEIAKRSLAA